MTPPKHDPATPPDRPAPGSITQGDLPPELPTADFINRHPWLRRISLLVLDTVMLVVALRLSYQIGFDFQPSRFMPVYHEQFFWIVVPLVLMRLVLLHTLGLYRGFTRYTGLHEALNIVVACGIVTIVLGVFNYSTPYIYRIELPYFGHYPIHSSGDHILRMPWGVVFIDGMLSILLVSGLRLTRRILAEPLVMLSKQGRRVLILGAGDEGEGVVRDLLRNQRDRYRPVAFVDPDPTLRGRRIHGIPVAGTLEDIGRVAQKYQAQLAVVALPRPTPRLLSDLVDQCQQARLEFKIIPDLERVMDGTVQVSQLRPVEIEDLLGRPPIVVPTAADQSALRGKRVLVTGAGGSIGAEICRQALDHRPAALVLLGRGENTLYEVDFELAARARELGIPFKVLIGNVRDKTVVEPIFHQERPQVVLHAAAHKHVHFMEVQPAEAIKNNVVGTRIVAETARAVGAEKFILISTDKAVRPTGVMGASKRIAEMVISALNGEGPTRFIAVRFGNVLGSRGSVIPLFRKQITKGGPITITHPDVTRYFMTIPEAVSLVLAAGALGSGGEVFLLDMGQPVKIVDLARQLITLSGLEVGRDIEIQFTGLRPGEKLFEELLTAEQDSQHTAHEKIYRSPQPCYKWDELRPRIERLEELAWAGDADGIRALLQELIPDYTQGISPPMQAVRGLQDGAQGPGA